MKTNELQGLIKLYGEAKDEVLFQEHRLLVKARITQKAKKIVGQISTLNNKVIIAERLVAHERRRRAEHPGTR